MHPCPSQLNGKGDVSIRLPWDGLARYWISQLEAHTPVSFVECMRVSTFIKVKVRALKFQVKLLLSVSLTFRCKDFRLYLITSSYLDNIRGINPTPTACPAFPITVGRPSTLSIMLTGKQRGFPPRTYRLLLIGLTAEVIWG